ncbi:hypothetical protein RFI_36570, partial [Reticulomyxa filosa]
MKYKSVWEISDDQCSSKSEHQPFNTWIRHNQDTNIGKLEDELRGLRGLIGGINNDLLFITYHPENTEIIDLKTMKQLTGIKNRIIPIEKHKFGIGYHCFLPLTMNNEKLINHFIFKAFHYEKLPICTAFNDFKYYSFVYLYDFIFLFGGSNSKYERTKNVYQYSMKEKTWNECKFTLPMEISGSFAILSDDDTNVHVIGGNNAKREKQKMH